MECSSVSKENEMSEKPAQLLFSFPEASLDAGTTWRRRSPAPCAPDHSSTLLTHPSFLGLSSAPLRHQPVTQELQEQWGRHPHPSHNQTGLSEASTLPLGRDGWSLLLQVSTGCDQTA